MCRLVCYDIVVTATALAVAIVDLMVAVITDIYTSTVVCFACCASPTCLSITRRSMLDHCVDYRVAAASNHGNRRRSKAASPRLRLPLLHRLLKLTVSRRLQLFRQCSSNNNNNNNSPLPRKAGSLVCLVAFVPMLWTGWRHQQPRCEAASRESTNVA
jgi:hypothetical protein